MSPATLQPWESTRTPSSAGFQGLICPSFNMAYKVWRPPCSSSGSLTGLSSVSETAMITLFPLPQTILLSPFTGEMLKLKILWRMHLNVVYFELCSSPNPLWTMTPWQLSRSWLCCQRDDPLPVGEGVLGWEMLKLLGQGWCNQDERFRCHLFSGLALELKCVSSSAGAMH